MIRDYKFDPAFADRPRKRGRGLLLIAAVLVLGSILGIMTFSGPPQQADNDEPAELALPEAAPAEIVAEESSRLSAPLALPQVGEPAIEQAAQPPEPETEAAPAPQPIENAAPSLLQQAPSAPPASETIAEQTPTEEPAELPQMSPSWDIHKIASGDSLARIFKARKLSPTVLHRIVNSSDEAAQLANIKPGQELRFLFDDEQELSELQLIKSPVESLHIRAVDDSYEAELVSKAVERRTASATGTIESSLFVDGQAAGLSDSQIMELAALFGWDVDFALEIRAGDQFRVIFEEQYLDGEKYKNGPILAAEFVNRGTVYQAYRFEDDKGEIGYYDEEGRNKRRAFIRTPIKFARISSRFTNKRWHPVLQKWRSHKGVDYAAPTGTPIKATGAGKVIFRGWKGGYGRVVIVQHGGKYQTLYAHMSKFTGKVKAGSRVKQGQIVGYVGKSGLASGPHLHYEFRINGVHRNPLTVKLPKSLPLPQNQLAAYRAHMAPLAEQLASIRQSTMLASSQD